MSAAQNNNATDTLNWDTVFAIPVPEANRAIVERKSSPTTFSYATDKGDRLAGQFGDWQIVQGGDGGLIRLSIPVSNVTGSNILGDFSWAKGSVIVEVRLAYLPQPDAPASTPNATSNQLKVRTASTDPTDPVVSLKTALFDSAPTGPAVDDVGIDVIEAAIPALLVSWLEENLADFDHVFATVDLSEYIDQSAGWAWCKPSYTDYAYVDGQDLASSVLGVLCMTGGRTGTVDQVQAIDRYAIPVGSIAGFLVAQQRMLADLMLPTLPMQWKNSTVDDYEVVAGQDPDTGQYQNVLRLKSGVSVKLDPISHDGSSYTPYLKTMSISIDADEVTFETYTETDVGMGITATCKATHWYTITLGSSKNGQTLVYSPSKDPVIVHGTQSSPGTEIEQWAIILAGILATVILGVLTDGAGFAVGAVVIGLLTGVAADTPSIIEDVNTDTSPSLDLLSFNTTAPIRWSSMGVFNLNYAGLNGPLQLGGSPNFG